jgi:hypothetical protein
MHSDHRAADLIATSTLLARESAPAVVRQLGRLTRDQFRDIRSVGSVEYADFVEAGPGDAERLYAYRSIAAFGEALRSRIDRDD